MAHVTAQTKARIVEESNRRNISMSALISELLERGLKIDQDKILEFKRSNKRIRTPNGEIVTEFSDHKEVEPPLPLEKE